MNWINLHVRTLRSVEYVGSDPTERATWLNVLAHCCDQENGGRITGARAWKDRQWQQVCGVTLREVMKAGKLLTWDGDTLVVLFYPTEKEAEVVAKREAGRQGGFRSGESRDKSKQKGSTASSCASPTASTEGEEEGKEKGKEVDSASASPRVLVILPTLDQVKAYAPSAGILPEAAECWWLDCDGRGVSPAGRFLDARGHEIRNWQSAMTSYGRKWQSNDAQKAKARSQPQPPKKVICTL